ncbi:MAG: glutamine--fructose-6-phosphate transaminase (isomerizing) [Elusimicrobia bacterium]|nr:glutamine--fructose-6-phosphate transaminase (isomerizing) [Elusimicrobiota bacterium]
MCGIVGYIGPKQAHPILLDGLKRLEYRGYDSAGLCVAGENGKLSILRAAGKIRVLEELLKKDPPKGIRGIGHSRWASHGKPSEENAHPHTDCKKEIVIVHNGIIENYFSLREELGTKGHRFSSETDTEVITHLLEENLQRLKSRATPHPPHLAHPLLFLAVQETVKELKGSFAMTLLWKQAPDTLIAVRNDCPLAIGLGDREFFVASDVPAFLPYTRNVLFLEDREIAVLSSQQCLLFNFEGKKVSREPLSIKWNLSQAEKGGYKHFMLKEIFEQPRAVEDTLRGRIGPNSTPGFLQELNLDAEILKRVRRVHLVGCGTAYHAGLVGKYLLEHLAGIPCEAEIASEFRYRRPTLDPETLLIAISQSGETADTLSAVREAKKRTSHLLAICNCVGSTLTREVPSTLTTHCGPEIGVASTKAFLGQLTALTLVALHAGFLRGQLSAEELRSFSEELLKIPGGIRQVLKEEPAVLKISKEMYKKEHLLYLGRHIQYPICLEGALKLKELSYIHAEGYAAGEMKHGPIALIDESMPVVALATRSRLYDKLCGNLQEAVARGAVLISVVNPGDRAVTAQSAWTLEVPEVPELLSPLVNIVPLQLFAYHMARQRGCDVDQPRNLAKSVTVE